MAPKLWPILKAVLVAATAFGAALVLTRLPPLSLLELKAMDLLFLSRGRLPSPQEIVIIAIDEPSFSELSKQWPWPRSLHARLIEQLKKAEARVIGLDILFAEPSDPDEDQALEQAIRKAGNVVLVSEWTVIDDPLFRHTVRVDPLPAFKEAAEIGITPLQIDSDGAVRRARLLTADLPSFPVQIARRYLAHELDQHPGIQPPEWQRWAGVDLTKNFLINHLGPPRTIKTVSYYQALDYEHMLPPGIFFDKIVLVGRSLQAPPEPQHLLPDTFLTPFSLVAAGLTSGVEIQATITSNLLQGGFIAELGTPARLALLIVLALTGSLMLIRLKPIGGLVATLVLTSLVLVMAYAAFSKADLWLPVFSGVLELGLVYGGYLVVWTLSAAQERRQMLEEMNRSLEEKIGQRTKELSGVNQALSKQHQQLEEAYQELARTQEQLIQSEKMASLGLLVAGVAHELNNPISFVHNNLDFIEEYIERLRRIIEAYQAVNLPDDAFRQYLEGLKKQVKLDYTLKTLDELIASCKQGTGRVKKIVMDLRTFSRTDDIGSVPVDLHQGIESTLSLLDKEYQDRITIHRDYGDLPKVECYPGHVNQVFMNLLQNAAQAIPGKGDIWIKTTPHGDHVTIAIRDNGRGILEKDLTRVFDPFFTTKPVGEGTGLGLSITYGIIQKHGGGIRVKSEVNTGTEFIVELPVRLVEKRHEAIRSSNR